MRSAAVAFDFAAQCFDQCNPQNEKILQLMFSKAKEFGRAPFHVLDVGCGTGNYSSELGLRFPNARLCGIDVSPQMIELAREKFSRADWVCGDFFTTHFPPRAFEFVLAIDALHLINWRQFVYRCNRVVSNNGRVFMVTGDRSDYSNIYYDHLPLLREKDLMHYPRVKQLRREFESLGFRTDCMRLVLENPVVTAEDVARVIQKAKSKAASMFHLVDDATLNACVEELALSLEKQVARQGFALEREVLYAVDALRKPL